MRRVDKIKAEIAEHHEAIRVLTAELAAVVPLALGAIWENCRTGQRFTISQINTKSGDARIKLYPKTDKPSIYVSVDDLKKHYKFIE